MRKRSRPKPSRPHSHTRKPPRQPRSYTPLSDALSQPLTFTDTELAQGIQQHSLAGLLAAAISRKRRCDGEPLSNLLCALLVWPLLKVKSLHCFCAELCQILAGQVSVLYDFLGREDINSLSSEGLPARIRDFQRHKRRKPRRCQAMTVWGWKRTRTCRQFGQKRSRPAQSSRSADRSLGLRVWRLSMAS
jgi:hypothetical protein